jgi:hypothetical protein
MKHSVKVDSSSGLDVALDHLKPLALASAITV